MKKLVLFICLLGLALPMLAQEEFRPVRTPEEEALKQTEMLQRELALTRQQYDTIYRIHLKYARLRRLSNTRQEALDRMNAMTQEMLNQMTPQQRKLFMGKQLEFPHRAPAPRMCQHDSIR